MFEWKSRGKIKEKLYRDSQSGANNIRRDEKEAWDGKEALFDFI